MATLFCDKWEAIRRFNLLIAERIAVQACLRMPLP